MCSCRFGLVPDRASARTGLAPTVFSSLSIPSLLFLFFFCASLFSLLFSLLSSLFFLSFLFSLVLMGVLGILAMTPLSDVRPVLFLFLFLFNWAWPGLMVPSNKSHILLGKVPPM